MNMIHMQSPSHPIRRSWHRVSLLFAIVALFLSSYVLLLVSAQQIRIPISRKHVPIGKHYKSARAVVDHYSRDFQGPMLHLPHASQSLFSDPSLKVPLHNFYNRMYTGEVDVGTPSKKFNLVFDTGSADLWCFAAASNLPILDYVTYYDPSASSTSAVSSTPWSIQYGKGSASGRLVSDTVSLAGKTATNYVFAQATSYSSDFESPDMPLDGLFGLAFSQVNSAGTPTLIDALKSAGQIKDRVFSFYLTTDNPDGSQFILGSPDMTLSSAGTNITYLDVTSSSGMWILSMQGVSINSNTPTYCSSSDCSVLMDTGTSFIGMPDSDFNDFARRVAQYRSDCLLDSSTGLISCSRDSTDNLPSMSFSIQGSAFTINPSDYYQSGVLGFMSIGSGTGSSRSNLWILGDTFLKTYYTVFDMDQVRIGIVGAKPGLPYSPPSSPDPYTTLSWQLILLVVGCCFAGLCLILCCVRMCHHYDASRQQPAPSPIYARSRASYVPPTQRQQPYVVQNAPPFQNQYHQPQPQYHQPIPVGMPVQAAGPSYTGTGRTLAVNNQLSYPQTQRSNGYPASKPQSEFARDFYASRA